MPRWYVGIAIVYLNVASRSCCMCMQFLSKHNFSGTIPKHYIVNLFTFLF